MNFYGCLCISGPNIPTFWGIMVSYIKIEAQHVLFLIFSTRKISTRKFQPAKLIIKELQSRGRAQPVNTIHGGIKSSGDGNYIMGTHSLSVKLVNSIQGWGLERRFVQTDKTGFKQRNS